MINVNFLCYSIYQFDQIIALLSVSFFFLFLLNIEINYYLYFTFSFFVRQPFVKLEHLSQIFLCFVSAGVLT